MLHIFHVPAGPGPADPDVPTEKRAQLLVLPAWEALQGVSSHRLYPVLQVHAGLLLLPC